MPEKRLALRLRGLRERRILSVAGRMLATEGCQRITSNEVAEGAGVSKGTVYAHFSSQRALLDGVLARASAQLLSRIRTESSDRGVREKLERTLSSIVHEIAACPTGKLAYPCCLRCSPCPYDGACDVQAVLRDLIEKAQLEGTVARDLDPGLAADSFQHLLTAAVRKHDHLNRAKDDLEAVCSLYLHGLIV